MGYGTGCFCENQRKYFFEIWSSIDFWTFTMYTENVMQSSIRNYRIGSCMQPILCKLK
ncbi:hypothetical protein Tsp_05396, partial [Trichinella spiralis]|uniref:hypothetical protein n=1 Tax=Trichinella spiralis TaxID=6334 RepID=UPI0001EFD546